MTIGNSVKRNKIDIVFSKLVRALAGYRCQSCGDALGQVKQLECAHVVSRRYRGTRWALENARCLCTGCHKFYTDNPLDWVEFIGIEEYQRLRSLAQPVAKFSTADKEVIYKNLKAQLAELERRAA